MNFFFVWKLLEIRATNSEDHLDMVSGFPSKLIILRIS